MTRNPRSEPLSEAPGGFGVFWPLSIGCKLAMIFSPQLKLS